MSDADADKPAASSGSDPPTEVRPAVSSSEWAPVKLLPSDDRPRADADSGSPAAAPAPAPPADRPEVTATVPAAEASWTHPAGSASPPPAASVQAPLDRPEVQVGLAFAGGLLAAMILKRLGR